jgi:hypothetical protein
MLEDRNAPNGLGNSSPFAADDWFDLLHDTTLFANLLSNDYDPDGDTLSITRINGQTYTPGTQITLHRWRLDLRLSHRRAGWQFHLYADAAI